jgi:hypothetical protein
MTDTDRSKRNRNRKKRCERLVSIRLTQREIEMLAARGYAVEPRVSLAAVVEAFVSDSLTGGRNPPEGGRGVLDRSTNRAIRGPSGNALRDDASRVTLGSMS